MVVLYTKAAVWRLEDIGNKLLSLLLKNATQGAKEGRLHLTDLIPGKDIKVIFLLL